MAGKTSRAELGEVVYGSRSGATVLREVEVARGTVEEEEGGVMLWGGRIIAER